MLNEVGGRVINEISNDYRVQQTVEKEVANAVMRVIVPRMTDDQRSAVVTSRKELIEAQANHRSLVDDIVDTLVRRGY